MKHLIIFNLCLITFFASCKTEPENKDDNKKFVLSDTVLNMIQIDTVRKCNIDDQVSLSGEVSFNENNVVKIFPRNSGQVIEAKVSLGDHVTKGQVLAVVHSADIAGNYSDLNSANADLSIAKRQMENTEALYKGGVSSEKEYNEAKQNYNKALAAKNKAEVTLTINGGKNSTSGGQYYITAPIDGYVVEKKITAGSYIRPDMGDYLYSISNLKNIWIYANVYETDISRVKEGYAVKVNTLAYPDKTYDGKIDKVSQVLDSSSKALRARIVLENPDMLLKPEMFARITVLNQGGAEALCIPTSAIISINGKNYVVVFTSKEDVKNVEVSVIKTVGDKSYISEGLDEGVKVITKYQLLIFNQLLSSK